MIEQLMMEVGIIIGMLLIMLVLAFIVFILFWGIMFLLRILDTAITQWIDK